MPIQFFKPHPGLEPYIQNYAHVIIEPLATEERAQVDFFPHGFSAMIVNLNRSEEIADSTNGERFNAHFSFSGQFDRYSAYQCKKANFIIINFKPFGAHYVMGIPQSEFLNLKLEMSDIFPTLRALEHQIEDLGEHVTDIIALLENWLIKMLLNIKVKDAHRYEFASSFIKQKNGNVNVQDLCRELGMSITSLEDHFKAKIGLSPKKYSRIIRFNECMKYINSNNPDKLYWSDIAQQFAYFDQMHFIKEFKQFYGHTPSKLNANHRNVSKLLTL